MEEAVVEAEVVVEETKTLEDVKSKISELEKEEEESLLRPSVKFVCPKVPQRLRSDVKDAEDCFEPKVISLGPYHHGKPHLKEGESLKLKLTATYIQLAAGSKDHALEQSIVDDIYNTISSKVEELKACYDAESIEKFGRDDADEEFIVMMMLDGCALLSYILCVCVGFPHEKFNIRYQDLSCIHQDVLLLENQLPYQSLLRHLMVKIMDPEQRAMDLWTAMFQEFFGMNEDRSFFRDLFFIGADQEENLFLRQTKNRKRNMQRSDLEEESNRRCRHVLDLYRRNFLGDERSYPKHNLGAGTGIGGKGMGVSVPEREGANGGRNPHQA